jgi:heme exporter protein CcmD
MFTTDHAFYLWMSYGAAAAAIVAEIVMLRLRRARAAARIEEERDLETTD